MPTKPETQPPQGILAGEEVPESKTPDKSPIIQIREHRISFTEWRKETAQRIDRLYIELQTLIHSYSLSCAEHTEHKFCLLDNRLRQLASEVSELGKAHRFPRFQPLELGDELSPTDVITPEDETQYEQIQSQIQTFEQELELFKQAGAKTGNPNTAQTRPTRTQTGIPARRIVTRPVDQTAIRQLDQTFARVSGAPTLSSEARRDIEAEMATTFNCEPSQIAHSQSEITADTKAYVGPLFPGIFQQLKDIEHIYTRFPEGRIQRTTIEIGGKTKDELLAEMKRQNISINNYVKFMIKSEDFTTAEKPEQADLVRLLVRDLNLQHPTTKNIYKRAKELGLELCPAEVGPHYRLQYTAQPTNNSIHVGMKQISDPLGNPNVFYLVRDDDGLWLYDAWANPTGEWYPGRGLVFRYRK